jgi:hypothetical protein
MSEVGARPVQHGPELMPSHSFKFREKGISRREDSRGWQYINKSTKVVVAGRVGRVGLKRKPFKRVWHKLPSVNSNRDSCQPGLMRRNRSHAQAPFCRAIC